MNMNFLFTILLLMSSTTMLVSSGFSESNCSCEETVEDIKVTCNGHSVNEVPQILPHNSTKIYMSGTGISKVYKGDFQRYQNLRELFFRDTPSDACELEYLEPGVFDGLSSLTAIGFVGCGRLTAVQPGVFATFLSLEILHIYRSGLRSVPDFSGFNTLNPSVYGYMKEIDLQSNHIKTIRSGAFSGVKVDLLKLEQNKISRIERGAFNNATIVNLKLNRNTKLRSISAQAFEGADIQESLDLSDTEIDSLPTIGLKKITHLILKNTHSLKHFPSVLQLPNVQVAELYYPHHCCAFNNPEKQDPEAWKLQAQEKLNEDCGTTVPTISKSRHSHEPSERSTYPGAALHTQILDNRFIRMYRDLRHRGKRFIEADNVPFNDSNGDTFVPDFGINSNGFGNLSGQGQEQDQMNRMTIGSFKDGPVDVNHVQNTSCGQIYVPKRNITCTPKPDAFNPCEDVMGYVWLRVTIWFVLLAALLGNGSVLFVLITSRKKFGVPKFLMCNLAFADLMMGVYLVLIASIDVYTLGEYFNYAVKWQNGGGCQVAGFLSVFSSEFSVFTLTILTLERWYAISHAIHLNKRLKFRHSVLLMGIGFLVAIVIAALPLVGVSGYGNVSICLPMKAKNSIDIGYLVSILIINGLMFFAICCCYLNMYWKVKGNANSARNNDATIAKRMAILVFTNFACWAPIAFFGLTASAGMPLIDITNSKILLVFFYPLNSCANPFLYAILTKQFRKDVFIFLGKYGICVEQANRYRGTYTSRSMSQSRGAQKEHMLPRIPKRTESIFSRLSNLGEGNTDSFGAVHSTPKVHPCRSRSHKDAHFGRAPIGGQEQSGNTESKASTIWKSVGEHDAHPPYVRSVSDYIGFPSRNDNANRCLMRTRKSTETTSTYVSSGAESSMDIISDTTSSHVYDEDVWQIRDLADSQLQGKAWKKSSNDKNKGRPFIYSQEEYTRISETCCYAVLDGIDVEKEDHLRRFLTNDMTNIFGLDNILNNPQKNTTDLCFNSKYRYARRPSLICLEENAESCLLEQERLFKPPSRSRENEIEMTAIESNMGHISNHSSLQVQGEDSL